MRITAACILSLIAIAGCSSNKSAEDAAYCESVKPGTVASVNHYCAVVPDHPVNPKVTTQWRGQTVGFCCQDCVSSWADLSDAQKDEALAAAVAKGKPKT